MLAGALEILQTLDEFDDETALNTVVDRLNQWIRQQAPDKSWKLEPRLRNLPEDYRDMYVVDAIGDPDFVHAFDGPFLRETAWMKLISDRVVSEQSAKRATDPGAKDLPEANPVQVASWLFDWTVRNIQLEEDSWPEKGVPKLPRNWHTPWETLLLGRGTASDRAWVFILLARQQNLPVVMIGVPQGGDVNRVKAWLPALVDMGSGSGESGAELYLFDPALGLPIPGPGGQGVATLSQAAADENVLKQLDVPQFPYPVKAGDLKSVVVLAEVSPGYLSQRMKVLESQLAGGLRMTLTASAEAIAQQLAKTPHVAEVRLWMRPYETWSARLAEDAPKTEPRLEMFMFTDWKSQRGSEVERYRNERLRNRDLVNRDDPLDFSEPKRAEGKKFPLRTGRLRMLRGAYESRQDAPGSGALAHLLQVMVTEDEESAALRANIPTQAILVVRHYAQAAILWLGQIKVDMAEQAPKGEPRDTQSATRLLEQLTKSVWKQSATYSLGRMYEEVAANERAGGRTTEADAALAKAIALYRQDDSPQRHGNLLRAKALSAAMTATTVSE